MTSKSSSSSTASPQQQERVVHLASGWLMLPVHLCLLALSGYGMYLAVQMQHQGSALAFVWLILGSIVLMTCTLISMAGFFTLEPNEARVLILFGDYKGTVRESGFFWGNPFYSNGPASNLMLAGNLASLQKLTTTSPSKRHARNKISLRARNLNGEKLKVNDRRGNPIEIAAVVVWRVADTAQAMFDVDDYEQYVSVQSEAAVRQIASHYAYDDGGDDEITLRGHLEQVSDDLRRVLQERFARAGVEVEEARLTHLAYAPEIAQAMLRRQQAEAVIAARQKIVQGAVGMVQTALDELSAKGVIDLDDERRAAMVSNLLVVLCGETTAQPVLNTGTLYT